MKKAFLRPIFCYIHGIVNTLVCITLLNGAMLTPAGICIIAFGIFLTLVLVRIIAKPDKKIVYPLSVLYFLMGIVLFAGGFALLNISGILAVLIGAVLAVFIDSKLVK